MANQMANQEAGLATLLPNLLVRLVQPVQSARHGRSFPLNLLNQPNCARRNATQTGFNETTGFAPAAPSTDPPAAESCIGNNISGFDCAAFISPNRSILLSYPRREVNFHGSHGQTIQPRVSPYEGDPAIDGTMFIALTSSLSQIMPIRIKSRL